MKICVLPGDGIGPEIMAQAVRVLNALRTDGLVITSYSIHYTKLYDPMVPPGAANTEMIG